MVRVIALLGPVNAGKTTVAQRLAATTGAVHLSADELRIRLCGHPAATCPKVWPALTRAAIHHHQAGHPVVLDSTGAAPQYRALLGRLGHSALRVRLECSTDTHHQREPARRRDLPPGFHQTSLDAARSIRADLVIATDRADVDDITTTIREHAGWCPTCLD